MIRVITIKIGVPNDGTPVVYNATVQQTDSAGTVERTMREDEKPLVARAITHFLPHLL